MARSQLDAGHFVKIACLREDDRQSDLNVWPDGSVIQFNNIAGKGYGFSPELIKFIRQGGFDIVHLQGIWNFASLAARFVLRDTPMVVSPRGMLDPWILNRRSTIKKVSSFFVEKPLLNRSVIHALNENEKTSIKKINNSLNVFVSPNAVTIPRVVHKNKTGEDGEFIFCYLGRLHEKKGIGELLTAVDVLKKKGISSFKLGVYGWGDDTYVRSMIEMSRQLSVDDLVSFHGPAYEAEKNAALSQADAFILPSYSEGLPMAVLEAASHRTRIIMTRECNLPEFFDKNAAFEITVDPHSIAEGMSKAMNSSDVVGENAYSLVKQKYSWDAVLPDLMAGYQLAIDEVFIK
ncbi:glycosyltransferase [Comamonadaceae bacterium PP-2]